MRTPTIAEHSHRSRFVATSYPFVVLPLSSRMRISSAVPIPDLGEEIGDDPFQVLLGLALIDPVEQPFETLPEEVEGLAGDGLAHPGAVDGFFDRQAEDLHGRVSSMDKAAQKTIYHE
jgi:hypothetical protein